MVDTWLVGVTMYVPHLVYPIPPLGYIPLDICTLLATTTSDVHGGISVSRGRGRTMIVPSRSVTTTSSHYKHKSFEIQAIGKERSVGILSIHKGQKVGKTSG